MRRLSLVFEDSATHGQRAAGEGGGSMPSNADPSFAESASVVQSMMGKDLNPDEDLLVLEINASKQAVMRNMNRWSLLSQCRGIVMQHFPNASSAPTFRSHRSDFFALSSRLVSRSRAMMQFRDLRCLQGFTEPVIHVRRGVLVVSMHPIRAVVTSSNMYVILRNGQDSELQPLVPRLRSNEGPNIEGVSEMSSLPFELQALDAVLYTAFQWHLQRVCESSDRAAPLINAVRRSPTARVLSDISSLQRSILCELEALQGIVQAIDKPQKDADVIPHMCLSRQALLDQMGASGIHTAPKPGRNSGKIQCLVNLCCNFTIE